MSASDHLNPKQFYHGTVSEGLHQVTPRGEQRFFRSDHDGSHAFATTDKADAWDYAEKAWNHTSTGVPRVYKVEAVDGDVEQDPHKGNDSGKWHRSKTGFNVVGEEQMPEHMGPVEDWR